MTTTPTTTLRQMAGTNWIVGTINDEFEVQAKTYTEPSHYGMELDGRISKLWIRSNGTVVYSYDRGLDIDNLDTDTLAMIVDAVAKKIA
jgi:hypothetical protein